MRHEGGFAAGATPSRLCAFARIPRLHRLAGSAAKNSPAPDQVRGDGVRGCAGAWSDAGGSAAEPPAERRAAGDELEQGYDEEIAREGLLAGLVPEQGPTRIGPGRPADQRQPQQPRLRYPPPLGPGEGLVEPEGGEGEEVEEEEGGGLVSERHVIHSRRQRPPKMFFISARLARFCHNMGCTTHHVFGPSSSTEIEGLAINENCVAEFS